MSRAHPSRAVFCNRTLNLRKIQAIGYDMDYTLVRYTVEEWERTAFEHLRRKLLERGWPVGNMSFDYQSVVRGLCVDRELGNICKANRFGYVKLAYHGTKRLERHERSRVYSRELVDLNTDRWVFVNTLFAISESCMLMQLIDVFDHEGLPGIRTYDELYTSVRASLDAAHMEGELKDDILAHPDRYIESDPELILTLQDQRYAGKKLLLITNSQFPYTDAIMRYAVEPHMDSGASWRDLFELVLVGARKPSFFSSRLPMLELAGDGDVLRPMTRPLSAPGTYWGGDAGQVEAYLGVTGDEILYIGDHFYGDVHQSKSVRRWRTGLILPELENELAALASFEGTQARLTQLMKTKTELEAELAQAHLRFQRLQAHYGPPSDEDPANLEATRKRLEKELDSVDAQIAPLALQSSQLHSRNWGLMLRTGNDKSHLARQIERYADVYTSRVSNFLHVTPNAYLRSPRGSLPHDPPIV